MALLDCQVDRARPGEPTYNAMTRRGAKNGTSFTIMDYDSEKGSFTISDPYFDNGKRSGPASDCGRRSTILIQFRVAEGLLVERQTCKICSTQRLKLARQLYCDVGLLYATEVVIQPIKGFSKPWCEGQAVAGLQEELALVRCWCAQ